MDSGGGVTWSVHNRTVDFRCQIYNRTVLNQARMTMKYVLTSTVQLHSARERSLMQNSIGWMQNSIGWRHFL